MFFRNKNTKPTNNRIFIVDKKYEHSPVTYNLQTVQKFGEHFVTDASEYSVDRDKKFFILMPNGKILGNVQRWIKIDDIPGLTDIAE